MEFFFSYFRTEPLIENSKAAIFGPQTDVPRPLAKMRSVTCGDIIFHSYQRKIVAISIAKLIATLPGDPQN